MSNHPELSLKPVEPRDLSIARRWRNDSRVYRWCRQYEPVGIGHHEDHWERVDKDPHTKMYGVEHGGILVGICGLTSIDWINSRAEFSLYIDPDKHRQGLGELALRKLVAHGFNVLNLNCIWGESFEGNPAFNMLKRIGFKEEGRRRSFYYREGKYIDAVLFSVLKDEYVNSDSRYSDAEFNIAVASSITPQNIRDWAYEYKRPYASGFKQPKAKPKTIRKATHKKLAKGKRRRTGMAKRERSRLAR